MSFVYVWYPGCGAIAPDTAERFDAVLRDHVEDIRRVNDRPVAVYRVELGGLHVGQLRFEHGIVDNPAWCEVNGRVVVFSGVCEDALGCTEEQVVEELWPVLAGERTGMEELAGRFSAFTWDRARRRGCIVTGATETMSLWLVRGPRGWAAGNRVRPLLALVGREARVDRVGLAMLIAYGYLIGKRALYEGAERIPSRARLRVDAGGDVRPEEYISLGDYIAPARPLSMDAAMERAEAVLQRRMARQASHSSKPFILLSGGWDSRCLAAALYKAGCQVPALTGGRRDTPDAQIAAEMAKRLGFPHSVGGGGMQDTLESDRCVARARAWSRASEGLENIRHAFSLTGPLLDGTVEEVSQGFNGLGGELHRKAYRHWAGPDPRRAWTVADLFDVLRRQCPRGIRCRNTLLDELRETLRDRFGGLDSAGCSAALWTDLFFWEARDLLWGMDMFSAKHVLWWRWTPFLDRELILCTLLLEERSRDANAFLMGLTARMAPCLSRVPHSKTLRESKGVRIRNRVLSRVPEQLLPAGALSSRTRDALRMYARLRRMWRDMLWDEERVWPEVFSPALLRAIAAYNPAAETLWLMATGELAGMR